MRALNGGTMTIHTNNNAKPNRSGVAATGAIKQGGKVSRQR